jgi:antitoxin component of RelBE/YafQ-DinJ toxin-antitoxin module
MKNSFLKFRIIEDDYNKFQKVCEDRGRTMSDVLRTFIDSYSNGENLILLDVDKDTLKESIELCKEKKVKFNDLIKFLLKKAIKNKEHIKIKT